MKFKAKVIEDLEKISKIVPYPLYWLDRDCVILGANEMCLEASGRDSLDVFIGKRFDEFHPKDIAEDLIKNTKLVIETGETLKREEWIRDYKTGKPRYFTAIRFPLRDEENNIIGAICSAIEITAEKESAELKLINENLKFENKRLELEKEAQKIVAKLEEHQKFRHIADQMAHDLGSPLMALSVLENSCSELPEIKRSMLRESVSRIRDIAGSLLSQYRPLEDNLKNASSSTEELLVYAALEQLIMNKQYEYHNLELKFEGKYDKNSLFCFINSDSTSFKRMLSNLINNSVEAMENQPGKITIELDSTDTEVLVNVKDTGHGIPDNVINKIMNNISVTAGKPNGHGIGFCQVHEVLKQNRGRLFINSNLGSGTAISLYFPRVTAPRWIAEEIILNSNDIIVILDDDNSIHNAWNVRFSEIIKVNTNIQVRYFNLARDVIEYIVHLKDEEKESVFLLTDYELLGQNLNGLGVIENAGIKRSILVTSHYNKINIREQAAFTNTKILPKILASSINIRVLQVGIS